MKIKNIGSKIVNIGTTVLMPEDTMPCNEAIANAPSIKALVKSGKLSIIKEAREGRRVPAGKSGTPAPEDGKSMTNPDQKPSEEQK